MIIGLLGRSRVGKDTFASQVVKYFGEEKSTIQRLSQPLKDAVCVLYDFDFNIMEESKDIVDTEYNASPRSLLVDLCNYMMNKHGKDHLNKLLYKRYDENSFNDKVVIVPDIRYEHDIQEIRKRNGIVIKIIREQTTKLEWENCIDDMKGDITFFNNHTKDRFEEEAMTFLTIKFPKLIVPLSVFT